MAVTYYQNFLLPLFLDLHARAPTYISDVNASSSIYIQDSEWSNVVMAIQRSLGQFAQITGLFGERPSPVFQAALLELEDAAAEFVSFQSQWGPGRSGAGDMAYQKGSFEEAAKLLESVIKFLVQTTD